MEPTHFVFFYSTASNNPIYSGNLDEVGNSVAITRKETDTSGTTLIKTWTIFNEKYKFDPNFPPSSNAHSVQNVMTHEFGHWLRLLDQTAMACSQVTMFQWSSPGETQKIDLAPPDREGINWQYPY